MAAGWLGLLGNVPWRDVIGNAPKLADGAKKLWSAVSGKADAAATAAPSAPAAPASAAPEAAAAAVAALQSKVAALQAATTDLRSQLLAGTELIKALADQNAQLVGGIEAARRRLARLVIGTALVGVVALAALVTALAAAFAR